VTLAAVSGYLNGLGVKFVSKKYGSDVDLHNCRRFLYLNRQLAGLNRTARPPWIEREPPPLAETQSRPQLVRFGAFEADVRTGELRKDGVKLKFSGHPFQVLVILLERPGDVVTREELQKRLWPDTFVDVERNLNTAINKIREVLGDSAESPRFLETLPRRGYRFIAPVEPAPSHTSPDPIEDPIHKPEKPRDHRPHYRLAIFSGLVLAAGFLAALWIGMTRPHGTPKVVRFIKLTNDGQKKIGPLVSDGVRIYFNEWLPDGRIVVAETSVKGGEVVPLSVPLNAPFVQDLSKDGTELLVGNDEGSRGRSVWVHPVAGGSPHRVGTVLTSWGPWGPGLDYAAFSENGTHVLFSQGYDIYSVSRDGSGLRKIRTVGHLSKDFRYSPDARTLRLTLFDPYTEEVIMSGSADATGLHELVDGCCGQWTRDGGYFIFSRAFGLRSDLWALPETMKFGGPGQNRAPVQLTAGPLDFQFALPARDRNDIFAIGSTYRAEVVRYDKKRDEFVPYLSGISAEGLSFSRDGQWVAYISYPDGLLWRSKVDGSEKIQLTFSPTRAGAPRWSPDGKQIAFFAVLPGGVMNIYVIPSGGGSAEHVLPSDRGQMDVDWSADGKTLVIGTTVDFTGSIHLIDLSSRQVSTLPGSMGLFSPRWSPDGRYIAAIHTQSHKLMLFDNATQSWTRACDCRVGFPMWSHDGKYIYFEHFSEQGKGYGIARLRPGDDKIETVADVSKAGRWTVGTIGQWFGLAPDDSPLVARDISTQEIFALEVQWP
jgi:DNA-binding winged helix-turn-helix (wHTH) protein/Tol biopolymer transport system component